MAVRRDAGTWLQEIAAPTLALVGELDGLTPPANSKRLAFEIPHAELCVIPEVGHLAPLEAPGRCARAIDGFLHRALDEKIRD
jgi:pimeloyl-ACP methyl ester carboxylesterase